MVYEWKTNSRIKANAAQAAQVFDHLERTGGLTPSRLVEASRPVNAPLHNEFTWNDKKAAAAYRETQARHLIMCLVVRDETRTAEEQTPVRAYFSVTEPTVYTLVSKVLGDDAMRAALLNQAERDMLIFRRKYETLSELSSIFQAMNEWQEEKPYALHSDPAGSDPVPAGEKQGAGRLAGVV